MPLTERPQSMCALLVISSLQAQKLCMPQQHASAGIDLQFVALLKMSTQGALSLSLGAAFTDLRTQIRVTCD
jgi:hypothetical protein